MDTGRQTSLAVATNDAHVIHDASVRCSQRTGLAGTPIASSARAQPR